MTHRPLPCKYETFSGECLVCGAQLGEPCEVADERARAAERDCTCRTATPRSTDIDPPAYRSIVDPWCPVHGRDPDNEYEEARDRAFWASQEP